MLSTRELDAIHTLYKLKNIISNQQKNGYCAYCSTIKFTNWYHIEQCNIEICQTCFNSYFNSCTTYNIPKIEPKKKIYDERNFICYQCKTTRTPLWRKCCFDEITRFYCNACGLRFKKGYYCRKCGYIYYVNDLLNSNWICLDEQYEHIKCPENY